MEPREPTPGLVEGLVETLDDLVGHGSPADLHEHLSLPLPVPVICKLLAVPYADRDRFRAASEGAGGLGDREASARAIAGHETTVTRIDVGTLLLLDAPDQWAALAADPGAARGAVEEVLRLAHRPPHRRARHAARALVTVAGQGS